MATSTSVEGARAREALKRKEEFLKELKKAAEQQLAVLKVRPSAILLAPPTKIINAKKIANYSVKNCTFVFPLISLF